GASGSLLGWQLCRGISGSFRVEWVADFVWNQWQPWSGIRTQFIYTENLREDTEEQGDNDSGDAAKPTATAKRTRNELRGDTVLVRTLRTAVEQTADDDGWAHLGKVGQYISNNSSFSPVNYGYKKLSDLIRASELFEMSVRDKSVFYIKSP
ncbi:OST-HTH/LOTUS domain-containing protein, partial [Marinobacter shengliensis]|uniref:OST-HTH/LOTUS domain-containing protein n=1 Tax=Marinobacter shengliensis TaxID=1389223 RepID=UPI001E5F67A7